MAAVAKAFAGAAASYDSWYRTPKGKKIFEVESRLLGRLLPVMGLGMEIGAGTGIFAEDLERPMRTIVCLDITHEMLFFARERGLPCILGSAYALPIRSGCLGFTYMVTVAEFLSPLEAAFREAREALGASGVMIVLSINGDSPWGALYSKMGEGGDPIFKNAHLLNVSDIEKALASLDYELDNSLGTLLSPPESDDVSDVITKPSSLTGVVAVSARKKTELANSYKPVSG